jgi:hypothetical protein
MQTAFRCTKVQLPLLKRGLPPEVQKQILPLRRAPPLRGGRAKARGSGTFVLQDKRDDSLLYAEAKIRKAVALGAVFITQASALG